MKRKDLAELLGVSAAMVSKLAARGMPTDSAESARAWRARHLSTVRTKEYRIGGNDGGRHRRLELRAADDERRAARIALERVAELGRLALPLLEGGQFGAVEGDLRQALRSVPPAYRGLVALEIPPGPYPPDSVGAEFRPTTDATRTAAAAAGAVLLPLRVWERLIEPVVRELRAVAQEAGEPPPPMTDADAEEMGNFLYSAAAGEVRVAGGGA